MRRIYLLTMVHSGTRTGNLVTLLPLLLLLIYLTSVVICSNARVACEFRSTPRGSAYLVLPFVPTRISRSNRQPQGLMNDCSIDRQSQSTIRFNLGSFLYWITGPFKDRYPPS